MTIGRVDSTGPVQLKNEFDRVGRVDRSKGEDSVSISSEAMEKAEMMRVFDMVKNAPDPAVRADRVAELRAKINDPGYITDKVLAGAADDIINMLF